MQVRFSLLLLLVMLSIAIASGEDNGRLERAQHHQVKRGVFDDIGDFFNNLGDDINKAAGKIKDFTTENFEKFKNSLSSLTGEKKDNALKSLTNFYNNLGDKTTAEAERVRQAILQLGGTVGGSSTVTGSLLLAALMVAISRLFSC